MNKISNEQSQKHQHISYALIDRHAIAAHGRWSLRLSPRKLREARKEKEEEEDEEAAGTNRGHLWSLKQVEVILADWINFFAECIYIEFGEECWSSTASESRRLVSVGFLQGKGEMRTTFLGIWEVGQRSTLRVLVRICLDGTWFVSRWIVVESSRRRFVELWPSGWTSSLTVWKCFEAWEMEIAWIALVTSFLIWPNFWKQILFCSL